jgi:SAM-dependent methyltransferase
MVLCVNLGCGDSIAKEIERDQKWINLDRQEGPGVDIVADLENGLPFEDESADLLYASHVLEHIKNFPALMKECHRVLKPRGCLVIKVPFYKCRAAIADPTHCWQFAPETWLHFDLNSNIGFDTLGMRKLGFICKWNQIIEWHRSALDDGQPGAYFTENLVDFEKDGPLHEWEEILIKMQQEAVAEAEAAKQ